MMSLARLVSRVSNRQHPFNSHPFASAKALPFVVNGVFSPTTQLTRAIATQEARLKREYELAKLILPGGVMVALQRLFRLLVDMGFAIWEAAKNADQWPTAIQIATVLLVVVGTCAASIWRSGDFPRMTIPACTNLGIDLSIAALAIALSMLLIPLQHIIEHHSLFFGSAVLIAALGALSSNISTVWAINARPVNSHPIHNRISCIRAIALGLLALLIANGSLVMFGLTVE